jgi:hypothetical protein
VTSLWQALIIVEVDAPMLTRPRDQHPYDVPLLSFG